MSFCDIDTMKAKVIYPIRDSLITLDIVAHTAAT